MRSAKNKPTRPLSFVVVVFSNEYFHNLLRSTCVNDSFNQLITVENTANLSYANLSEAINAGLAQARHELLVVVHEDVYLPPEWQTCFEVSLQALEEHDPRWGVVGTAGWTEEGKLVGHFRDPHGSRNTFGDTKFMEVKRIDEQVMVLRKSAGLRPDPQLPSIHNIGRDLPLVAKANGLRTYVIDAQSIHKYADAEGNLIQKVEDSPKILDRKTYTYLADKACSDEYFYQKWPAERPLREREKDYALTNFSPEVLQRLESPVVLLARGGSGSRLLSLLATDSDLFIGNEVNDSGDCLEMRMAIYQGVLAKFSCKAAWQKELTAPRLRFTAAAMLQTATRATTWGFKLSESMLLTPEIDRAFPRARYVHLIRDPLTTCLRRTHMTARLDNHIGRVALPVAYRYCGLEPAQILQDSPALHMAYTTRQQVETVRLYCRSFLKRRYLELRFEDMLRRPREILKVFSQWLNGTGRAYNVLNFLQEFFGWRKSPELGHKLEDSVDITRAAHPRVTYPAQVVKQVEQVLAPLRKELGYLLSVGICHLRAYAHGDKQRIVTNNIGDTRFNR